jgi:hypothetical protein
MSGPATTKNDGAVAARPVTVLELAEHRLGRRPVTGSDFDEAGLPIIGTCEACAATIAAYNACPTTTGYLRCATGCSAGVGYETAAAADAAVFGDAATTSDHERRTSHR